MIKTDINIVISNNYEEVTNNDGTIKIVDGENIPFQVGISLRMAISGFKEEIKNPDYAARLKEEVVKRISFKNTPGIIDKISTFNHTFIEHSLIIMVGKLKNLKDYPSYDSSLLILEIDLKKSKDNEEIDFYSYMEADIVDVYVASSKWYRDKDESKNKVKYS